MMMRLRRYFISGLLVWLPLWATVVVIRFLVDLLGSTMLLLPRQYRPEALLGVHIPGLDVLIILAVILFTGMVAANFVGRKLVELWEALMGKIPLVRTIYHSVSKVLRTIFSPGGSSFRKVLLVEFPRPDVWSIAFQTGDSTPLVDRATGSSAMVSLFIPMTPNPTSGFLLMVPREKVIELDMPIEQAFKFVISLGVMQPGDTVSKVASKSTPDISETRPDRQD